MVSNNEFLLEVVSGFQDRLIKLLNKIGESNGKGIRGEIKELGENYNDSECAKEMKEKYEKYEKMIADVDKSGDTPTDTPPGPPPSDIQEDVSIKLIDDNIINYVFDDLILSQKGREYFPESTGSAPVNPEGEVAGRKEAQPAEAATDNTTEIENLRQQITKAEEELNKIRAPITTVESPGEGSAIRPDIAAEKQEEQARPIEKKLDILRTQLGKLTGTAAVGGGKKKRTYKKKKKRRSKKKRTLIKRRIKYK